MALGTPSIAKLQYEKQETLKELGVSVEEDIAQLSGRARTRVMKLFMELKQLEALASTDDQIEEYGTTEWNNHFVRAEAVFPGNLELALRKLGNSRFAQFMRMFSAGRDLILPRLPQGKLDTHSLRPTLVRPDYVADEFLVDLGLIERAIFEHLRGDPMGRIAKKAGIPTTNGLKLAFEHMQPLGAGQRRMLVVEKPTDTGDYPEDTPLVSDDAVGALVYVREYVNGNSGYRRLQPQFYESAYAALRKTFHEDESYAREIDGLVACQADVQRMIGALNEGYRKHTPQEEKNALWEQTERIVLQYNEFLEACVNKHKIDARQFLLEASELRDRAGKPNISRVMSKMTAGLNRIAKRFDDMKPKSGFNSQDRVMLHEKIQLAEHTLLHARHSVRDASIDLEAGKKTPAQIRKSLELSVRELENIRIRPLRKPAQAMIRQIQALTPETPDAFTDQLLTLHVIGKIQGLHSSLERIRGRMAQSGSINAPFESNFMKHVQEAFGNEQIFEGKRVPRLEAIMEPLNLQLADLRERLENQATLIQGLTQPSEVRENLEAALDAFETSTALDAIALGMPEPQPYAAPFTLTNK